MSNTNTESYQILRAHDRTDKSHKSLEALESEYINLTDKLIYTMTHGEQVLVDGTYETVVPTKVIFLDKSARPLAWLTGDLWEDLAPTPDNPQPIKPDFKFLNIDRKQWLDTVDPNENGLIDVSRIPEDLIIGLRSLYNKDHDGSFDAPNELDNQVIMIVDEVIASGRTLEIAQKIIRRAFPNSIVFGAHWMSKQYREGDAIGNADLPVWYRDDTKDPKNEIGRGVGNRVIYPDGHPSQHFLSRRFSEPDQKSLRLREDFKELTARLQEGEVLYVPYDARDTLDQEGKSRKYNQLSFVESQLAHLALRQRDAQL